MWLLLLRNSGFGRRSRLCISHSIQFYSRSCHFSVYFNGSSLCVNIGEESTHFSFSSGNSGPRTQDFGFQLHSPNGNCRNSKKMQICDLEKSIWLQSGICSVLVKVCPWALVPQGASGKSSCRVKWIKIRFTLSPLLRDCGERAYSMFWKAPRIKQDGIL